MLPTQTARYDPRSSRGDKFLFGILFVVGAVLIVGSKLLRLHDSIPVSIAVLALVSYAFATSRIDRFRLREDRAGDNAYYLGFLFTLISLSFALWSFQQTNFGSVESVINNFALALISTICGLAIRVLFQQLRDDPVEFEHEARLALGNAVSELHTQLIRAVEDFSTIRARLSSELQQDFVQQAKDLSNSALGEIRRVGELHGKWLAETATQLKDDRNAVITIGVDTKGSISRVSKALQALAAKIEADDSPTLVLRQRFNDLAAEMEKLLAAERSRAEAYIEQMKAILAILGSVNAVSAGLDGRIRQLAGLADSMITSIAELDKSVRSINSNLTTAAGLTKESIETTANDVRRTAEQSIRLSQQLKATVDALAGDVKRSAADVTAVRAEMVQAAELVTRQLGGGRD